MKRTLGVLMAAILLLSLQVFASADDSTAVRTTDEVTVTDAGVLILTEDGLAISYTCPTENVAAVPASVFQRPEGKGSEIHRRRHPPEHL